MPDLLAAELERLAEAAEARTTAYFREWLKVPAVKAAIHAPDIGRQIADLRALSQSDAAPARAFDEARDKRCEAHGPAS